MVATLSGMVIESDADTTELEYFGEKVLLFVDTSI
jgi:hypothetical protein